MALFSKKRKYDAEVAPDEIFLDSKNIPDFDTQQFEGRIEKPIRKSTIIALGFVSFLILAGFGWRLAVLQIARGEAYYERSLENTLNKIPVFANRGVIYDRNGVPLAWNEESANGEFFSHRSYIDAPGSSLMLGYVSYPSKDASGYYWQTDFVGKDGIEKQYNDRLSGTNGAKIVEVNAMGEIVTENVTDQPEPGENITLALDSRIQTMLYSAIGKLANSNGFTGGAAAIMDVHTGELLASVSYPEYDSELLSLGDDSKTISSYIRDPRKVFLNRVSSGLFAPGSIVKPYVALAALNEGIISPEKSILSTGSISIPNPYFPGKFSVFKDWKAHGWVDMRRAIAVSSDVYFYAIGGGFQDQKGLGIANIDRYVKLFGLSTPTGIDLPKEASGIIPTPEWKEEHFDGDPWRIGDTYNTAIGQYGFQATLAEMLRAVGALANYGTLLTPHLIAGDMPADQKTTIDIPREFFQIIHEGMQQGANAGGTAAALEVPYVDIAAKTGTAQVGPANRFVNSWVTGFFPYENPKYAFIIMMEHGPVANLVGASYIGRQLFDWMHANAPEYLE